MSYLDDMVKGYIECALWSSTDNEGEPLDKRFSIVEIEDSALDKMAADCAAFFDDAGALLDGIDAEQAGHDFWLTRNRHGAGFWDRGLGVIGDVLTERAHAYGEAWLYVAGDGTLGIA